MSVTCRFCVFVGDIGGFPRSDEIVLTVGIFGRAFCGVGGGNDAFESDKLPLRLPCLVVFVIFAFLVNAFENELRSCGNEIIMIIMPWRPTTAAKYSPIPSSSSCPALSNLNLMN